MTEDCCPTCGNKLAGSPLDEKRKRLIELADGTRTAKQIGLELGFSTTRVVQNIDKLRRRGHVINIPRGAGSTPGYNAYTPEQRAQQRRDWKREIDEECRQAEERRRNDELHMRDALRTFGEEVVPWKDAVSRVVEFTGLPRFDVELFLANKINNGVIVTV